MYFVKIILNDAALCFHVVSVAACFIEDDMEASCVDVKPHFHVGACCVSKEGCCVDLKPQLLRAC